MGTFIKRYFDPDTDLGIQAFNLLALAGGTVSFIAALNSLLIGAAAHTVLNLAACVLAAALLRFARKTGRYRFCFVFTIVLVFWLAFPVLFFTAGGYRSGMPCFFVFAIVFTALMLEGKLRFIGVFIEFALYAACCLTAYWFPALVTPFTTEREYVQDVIVGVIFSGLPLLLVVVLYIRIYSNRQNRLAELDMRKTEFLGNMSHEMKTPLTVISSYAQLAGKSLAGQPDVQTLQKHMKLIESEAERLSLMVSQILDVTRIEEHLLIMRTQPCLLGGIIAQTLDTYYPAFSKNRNRLVFEPPAEDIPVLCDPHRVAQVMVNLISNAAQHTQNGVITVEIKAEKSAAVVTVTDTGAGMEEAQLAHLFDRYYTSADSGKTGGSRNTGTGLGLFICRHIILKHGGDIAVQSQAGKGTSVRFTLPRGSASQ